MKLTPELKPEIDCEAWIQDTRGRKKDLVLNELNRLCGNAKRGDNVFQQVHSVLGKEGDIFFFPACGPFFGKSKSGRQIVVWGLKGVVRVLGKDDWFNPKHWGEAWHFACVEDAGFDEEHYNYAIDKIKRAAPSPRMIEVHEK